jgi:hypothetical protein
MLYDIICVPPRLASLRPNLNNYYTENADAEEQELEDKISKISSNISSKLGVGHANEDAQDEKRDLNYEAIIEAKREVSVFGCTSVCVFNLLLVTVLE